MANKPSTPDTSSLSRSIMEESHLTAIKAVSKALAAATLSEEQKAELLVYFCDNPTAAAALPEANEIAFRDAFFRRLLKKTIEHEG